MKNLLLILATLLPLALSGQAETAVTPTPIKKNTITASTYLSSTSGIALDYRRNLSKNREFIVGTNTSFNGINSFNVGFRKYYYTENKLSVAFGVDAGLKKRNIIGDNLISRTIENTMPKLNYGDLKFVAGTYYKLDNKFNLMAEVLVRPLGGWFNNSGDRRKLKVGLQYKF